MLSDEIMTATHVGDLEVSLFTLLLLKETHWYTSINTTKFDDVHFGRNRGCDFVYN